MAAATVGEPPMFERVFRAFDLAAHGNLAPLDALFESDERERADIAQLLRTAVFTIRFKKRNRVAECLTAMHVAASFGSVELLDWLHTRAGVAVDIEALDTGVPPLFYAMRRAKYDAATWLLAHGATLGPWGTERTTALHAAILSCMSNAGVRLIFTERSSGFIRLFHAEYKTPPAEPLAAYAKRHGHVKMAELFALVAEATKQSMVRAARVRESRLAHSLVVV